MLASLYPSLLISLLLSTRTNALQLTLPASWTTAVCVTQLHSRWMDEKKKKHWLSVSQSYTLRTIKVIQLGASPELYKSKIGLKKKNTT